MADFAAGFSLERRPIVDFLNPAKPLLAGAWDAESVLRDNAIFTWVAGRNDHAIQLIRHDLGLAGVLRGYGVIAGSVTDAQVGGLTRVTELETVTAGGKTFLLSLGNPAGNTANPGVITSFEIGADLMTASGGLTRKSAISTGLSLMESEDFLTTTVGNRAFVISFSAFGDGQLGNGAIGVHQLRGDGTFLATQMLGGLANPGLPLSRIIDAEAEVFQGRRLVLTGASISGGLALWQLDGAGQLTLLDRALTYQDQSVPTTLGNLTAVHIAVLGTRAFAFAYDTTQSRIITYEVVGTELVYRSDSAFQTRLAGQDVSEIKSFVASGSLFLVTSNTNANSLSLMVVGPDGQVSYAAEAKAGLQTRVFENSSNPADGVTVAQPDLGYARGFDLLDVGGDIAVAATAAGGNSAFNLLGIGKSPEVGATNAMVGTEQDDRFFGLGTSIVVTGNGGDDQVLGGTGTVSAQGGAGRDSLYGGDQNDSLYGGSGPDRIFGAAGDDLLNGGKSFGTDTGLDGGDSLEGGSGRDTLDGGRGNDTLAGGADRDVLYGGTHADLIDGGGSADLILSGQGNDTVAGGTGADDFLYRTDQQNDHDLILDFEIGLDQVKFTGPVLDTFGQVIAATDQQGPDAVITIAAGHTITLQGIDRDDLTAADFLFA